MMNREDELRERKRDNFRGNVYVSDEISNGFTRASQEFIGKAVISIADGRKIGTVSDIMIDRDTLKIAAVATSKGNIFNREVEAISAENVEVWGRDVILVTGSDVINKEENMAGKEKWLYVSDHIRGRYVVSVDGQRVGQISDVIVDRDGRILGYELNQVFVEGPLAETKRIEADATHAMGQDVLVVNTIQGLSKPNRL